MCPARTYCNGNGRRAYCSAGSPVGQRPAAIRTFYQPGENLCRTVLALPAAACYLLLHLIENLLADNRLLRVLHPHPIALGLAYPTLVFEGNVVSR